METKTNTNGLAIYNALKEANAPLTLAEIANIAGIKAETGYLTAARKIAKDNGYNIVKNEKGATLTIKTITIYPNGLEVEKMGEKAAATYELVAIGE